MRAISRFAIASRAVFSSAPVAAWNRRLKSSCRVSRSRCSSSSSVSSRTSLAFKETRLPRHELRLDRQLLRREAERLLGERLGHAGQLEHHLAGLDDRDPPLGRALAGAHARLGRLLRERLVREEVDPDLAAALDLARHRDTGRLDLAVGDPAGLEGLDAVLAEMDVGMAGREAAPAAAMDAAELLFLRHQHQRSPPFSASWPPPDWSSFCGSSCIVFGVVVSGASATGFGVSTVSGWITGCSRPSAERAASSVRGFSTLSCPRARSPCPGRWSP